MSDEESQSRGRKVYGARSFAKSAMSCPGCHVTLAEPVEKCPRCGYTGGDSMNHFPFPSPPMGRFIDPGGHLDDGAREKVAKALTDLSRKFPQPRFCFCLIDLAAEADPREFGFWMMNASPVNDPEEAQARPWTILLVIDHANGRASVTPGYAVEPYVNDEDWISLMRRERKHFFGRDYQTALVEFVKGAEEILGEGADRTDRVLKKKRSSQGGDKSRRKRVGRRPA